MSQKSDLPPNRPSEAVAPTSPVKKAPKAKSPKAEDLLKTFAALPDEEREKLMQMGISVPVASAGGDTALKFGIRCRHCARVALEFVGEEFVLQDGSRVDEPPVGHLQINQIPWTQSTREAQMINRSAPVCQHCNGAVQTRNHLFFVDLNVVNIEHYTHTRTVIMDKFVKDRRSRKKLGKAVPGSLASNSYDRPGEEFIHPDARERAVQHASMVGLDEAYLTMGKGG